MGWPPQVWAALIGAVAGSLLAALKYTLDQRARMVEDLWSRRLEPYREIWALSAYFSRWPRQDPTCQDVLNLQEKLRLWYYGNGGILMSTRARRRYEYVQRGLEVIRDAQPAPGDKVHKEDYDQMMEIFSRFRSALTDDLESRRKRSFVYSLVDLGEDRRVQRELKRRYQEMLARHHLPRQPAAPAASVWPKLDPKRWRRPPAAGGTDSDRSAA